MKGFMKYFLFISIFVVSFVLTVGVSNGAVNHSNICKVNSTPQGSTNCSYGGGTVNDSQVNFKANLTDNMTKKSAYVMVANKQVMKPKVTRGTPVAQNIIVRDQKNNKNYTYTNRNGQFLNDFISSTIGFSKREMGYYPQRGSYPVVSTTVKSNTNSGCIKSAKACNTYTYDQQFTY